MSALCCCSWYSSVRLYSTVRFQHRSCSLRYYIFSAGGSRPSSAHSRSSPPAPAANDVTSRSPQPPVANDVTSSQTSLHSQTRLHNRGKHGHCPRCRCDGFHRFISHSICQLHVTLHVPDVLIWTVNLHVFVSGEALDDVTEIAL